MFADELVGREAFERLPSSAEIVCADEVSQVISELVVVVVVEAFHGHLGYRIYCELELNLRIKPRKRLKRDKPDALAVPEVPNITWSMRCPVGVCLQTP